MDLRLHIRVLWKYRLLVLGGLTAAVVLCFFSYFRVDVQHGLKVSHREAESWQSSETLLLTQTRSPLFSANPTSEAATQDWLTTLPGLYSAIANSDVIAGAIRRDHSLHGKYVANQVFNTSGPSDTPLPLLEFDAVSPTSTEAVRLATAVSNDFLSYLTKQQTQRRIPPSQRVLVHVVTPANVAQAQLLQGRSKTVPMVVFLALLAATIGLAHILENLRPSVSPLANVSNVVGTSEVRPSASLASDDVRRRRM